MCLLISWEDHILAEYWYYRVYGIFSAFQSWLIFNFIIVNFENATLNQFIEHISRGMFMAISEIARNSALSPIQNLFNIFCSL